MAQTPVFAKKWSLFGDATEKITCFDSQTQTIKNYVTCFADVVWVA